MACLEFSPPHSPDLAIALQNLIDGDFDVRWDASKQLVRLGPATLSPLLKLLQEIAPENEPENEPENAHKNAPENEDDLPWFIARILGELRHPLAVSALNQLIQTTNQAEVAAIAATSLAKSGDLALPALQQLLRRPQYRVLAVQALAQSGLAAAVPLLISVVRDENSQVRAGAVDALTTFRDEQITPVLAAALDDPSAMVRLAAVRRLGSRGQQLPQITALILQIARLLEDLNDEVGIQAAIALGRLQAIGPLDQLLDRPLIPLRLKIQVIRSLAWCETPAALKILQRRLQESLLGGFEPQSESLLEHRLETLPENSERHAISLELIQVLGRMEQPDLQDAAADGLLAVLGLGHHADSFSSAQAAALALSLGQLARPQAFEPLVRLLERPIATVRFQVVAALRRLDPALGRQRLEEMRLAAIAPTRSAAMTSLAEGIDFALFEW